MDNNILESLVAEQEQLRKKIASLESQIKQLNSPSSFSSLSSHESPSEIEKKLRAENAKLQLRASLMS